MKITLQRTSPNYRQKLSTHRIMRDLTIGLLVIVAYSLFYYYYNFMSNNPVITAALIYIVSIVVGVGTEAIWAVIHKNNVLEQIKNGFPWVTAIIFALTLPIGTPLYVVAIGSFVSIFIGKLVFGGFGHNIFNPALVGRVLVHLSFGAQLVPYVEGMGNLTDLASSATPAAALAATNWMGGKDFSYALMDLFLGNHGGTLGETCIWLILLVGVVLAVRRVFDARIPVAYLGTVLILSGAFALFNGLDMTYPLVHLCIGGVVFGAVIMATDPVTSPSSPLGKILFGIGLGFLTIIIRLKANYPEGVLFSILMMNMLTPWIDSLVLGRTNKNIGKQIVAIVLSLGVAIGCVAGASYSIQNEIEAARLKAEEDAKKKEEAERKKAEEEANKVQWEVVQELDDGYIMSVKGFGGDASPMKVEVKLADGTITSVKVLEYAGETAGYGKDMIEGTTTNEKQKAFMSTINSGSLKFDDVAGIDTSTGATMTTKGIVNAIKGAIEAYQMKPVVDGDTYTYTLTAKGFGGDTSPLKVKVAINKTESKVTGVEVLEYAGETAGYGKDMIEGTTTNEKQKAFMDKVKGGFAFADAAGIDTSTGATLTAKGIMEAVNKAITHCQSILTPNAEGYYEVSVAGFGGDASPMKVLVKVDGDNVSVKVAEYAGETAGYGKDLIEGTTTNAKQKAFYDKFIANSFKTSDVSGVDTATGATMTTKGIVSAIEKAIAAAK